MIRRLSLDWLQQLVAMAVRRGHNGSLLFIDMENSKARNDASGYLSGDPRLDEVSERLTDCVREFYALASLPNDEFVVLMQDRIGAAKQVVPTSANAGRAELKLVQWPVRPGTCTGDRKGAHVVGSSGGLRRAGMGNESTRIAIGRSTPGREEPVRFRKPMEDDLRESIELNEFTLYYQPQVDHGDLIGVEALARWRHPQLGLLEPDMFIPLAEETGLILELGDQVLRAACSQIAAWAARPETAQISIAVNISARQFRQPDFVERVLAALRCTGANPQNLTLELTESLLVEDFGGVIAKMNVLKACSISLSLDDFGTGYSSLAYLRRLPVDQLKIDSSFVREMLVDSRSGAIAQTIVSLGDAMGLNVIAEGVETVEQLDYLDQLGCHCFQGYLISQPLPLDEFEPLLPALIRPLQRSTACLI